MYFIGVDPSESSDNRSNVFAADIIYLLSEVKQQVENTKLAGKIQANISWVYQSEKPRSQRHVTQDLQAVSECDNPLCSHLQFSFVKPRFSPAVTTERQLFGWEPLFIFTIQKLGSGSLQNGSHLVLGLWSRSWSTPFKLGVEEFLPVFVGLQLISHSKTCGQRPQVNSPCHPIKNHQKLLQ